jgi:23S rRNA (uracil1939-C5)-methyltransferase
MQGARVKDRSRWSRSKGFGILPSYLADMEELTVTIDSLSHGVFGVARTERGVVFVPGTAPGDLVRIRIVDEKRHHREAELIAVIEPSPDRRTPPCRFIPECGGCPWQHVAYPAQLAAKRSLLEEALVRIGGLDRGALDIRPIIPSDEWSYRHRLTLRVDGEQRLGFYRQRSHQLVEIDACLIADEPVNRHLAVAREWLRGVSTTVRRVEIASARDCRVAFVANCEGPFRHDDPYHERFLKSHPSVSGIVLFGHGWRHVIGKPVTDLEVDGGLVIESRGGFTQVNPAANERLVATVAELASPSPSDRVLDLYCGVGNFTLPLARRTREIVGVESDASAIGAARRNAERAAVSNCRFLHRDAAGAAVALAAEGERFSLVVLDPPRSGAAEVVEHLAAGAVDRLVYVSCNPPTLARDLRRLCERGFMLGPLQPIDLFPQTYHLETVALLRRHA